MLYTNLSAEECIKIPVFADASSVAYGAVSFLRITEKNDIKCKLVPAKLRLCPIKEKKLAKPKLELKAAAIISTYEIKDC